MRTTVGEPEPLAAFAGQVAGAVHDIPAAAELIERIMNEAHAVLRGLRHLEV